MLTVIDTAIAMIMIAMINMFSVSNMFWARSEDTSLVVSGLM